jgi:predicted Zn-dependent protease
MPRTSLRPAWVTALLLAACATTPISGRQTLIVLPATEDVNLGAQAYDQALGDAPRITSGAQFEQVKRAMDRLVAALGSDDPGFPWEVTLIDDPATVNAFCLPGGKMAVYTGILPVAASEAGLAVVMGHEIAHALARHGVQRMQLEMGKQGLLELAASFYPEYAGYSELADTVMTYTVSLPWGRGDELEADEIGLILMARAGYDPREAAKFWERMSALGESSTPSFLSTHPSHGQRIDQLNALLPKALEIYNGDRQQRSVNPGAVGG